MKTLKFLTLALFAVVLASCSNSFNDKRAGELVDILHEEGEWNEKQTNEAVDLLIQGVEEITDATVGYIEANLDESEFESKMMALQEKYSNIDALHAAIMTMDYQGLLTDEQSDKLNDAFQQSQERMIEAFSKAKNIDDDLYSEPDSDEYMDEFDEYVDESGFPEELLN